MGQGGRIGLAALVAAGTALTAACVTRTVGPVPEAQVGGEPTEAVAPALVVERFLQAANANDLATMGRLFGTRDGPITERQSRSEVEQRMFVLASVLRHTDYALEREQLVPGRSQEAVQIVVRLRVSDGVVPVPFVVVRSGEHGWLVEQIGIEAITAGRRV